MINSNNNYVGFFGKTQNVDILNLYLEDVNIIGKNYLGVIAGDCYNTNINNIYVDGKVFGYNRQVGGVVGNFTSSTRGNDKLSNIVSYVEVTASEYNIGGVVGYVSGDGTLLENIFYGGKIIVYGDYKRGGYITGIIQRSTADKMFSYAEAEHQNVGDMYLSNLEQYMKVCRKKVIFLINIY